MILTDTMSASFDSAIEQLSDGVDTVVRGERVGETEVFTPRARSSRPYRLIPGSTPRRVHRRVRRRTPPTRRRCDPGRPPEVAGVVVDDHDQVAVATLVGDLVDPDAAQPGESIDTGFDVCVDPGDDRTDRAPRHAQQFADFEVRIANHAARSSKSRVWPTP